MPETELGETLDVLIDHRGKTVKKLGGDFCDDGVPVVSAVNIKNGRIDFAQRPRFVSQGLFSKWMPTPLRAQDVILTSEAPLGEVALVPSDEPLVLGQRLFALRGKKGILDNRYLYYVLQWAPVKEQLAARSTGTTVMGIRQAELVKIYIPLAPFSEQRAIASVLRALDDKIEANHQIGRVSWSLATAHFDALVAEAEKFVPLGSVLTLAYGKALPARSRMPGITPVFGSGGIVGWHNKPLVSGPGIVIGRKGTAGAVHWCYTDFFPIDTTFYVETSSVPMLFAYFLLRSLGLDGMNSDSAVPGLNRSAALARTVALPAEKSLAQFSRFADPLVEAAESADRENRTLSALRDTLLPKLLSGAIHVRDAESRTEAEV